MFLGQTGDLLTDIVGVASEALPTVISDIGVAVGEIIERKRDQRKTFKESEKVGRAVSDYLYDDIREAANNNDLYEIDLISTAIKTNKWINYAIYYMTEDDSHLLKCNYAEREFLNSISMLAGFGRMYQSAGVTDLREFDIKNPDRKIGTKFILLFDELLDRIHDEEFIQKMKIRKTKLGMNILSIGMDPNYKGSHSIDNDGYIHPVFFMNPVITDIGEKKGPGIDQVTFDRLENSVGKLIMNSKYKYSRNENGLIDLEQEIDNSFGAIEKFVIDDGLLLGGTTISILGYYDTINGGTDKVFVDVNKHPDIAFNILKSVFYKMSADEVNVATADLLNNGFIYTYIDFNNTPWFDYLGFTDKITLSNNLVNIVRYMGNDPNLAYPPRLRFLSYKDPDNFTLISDNEVKSPLSDTFETTPNILEGLSFVVQDGSASMYYGGQIINPVLGQPLINQMDGIVV